MSRILFKIVYVVYFIVEFEMLKWSFTYKQHARGPFQNHSWKFDLWPLQTEILKIKAGFAEKMPKKVEIITRTPAEVRPSDFSLRFLT